LVKQNVTHYYDYSLVAIISTMINLDIYNRKKYNVIKDYTNGKITRKQAAIMLDITVVHISRLKQEYLQHGKQAFVHKNKDNNNAIRTDKDIEKAIVRLYKTKFQDFNFTHFYEYITDNNLLKKITKKMGNPSVSTIKRILTRNGVVSPQANKKKRKVNQHPSRCRRTGFGELIQLDASIHDWFGTSIKATLHLAIDDATSMILGAHFEKQETTKGYYHIFYQILTNFGIPTTFYTDNRSSFMYSAGKTDKDAHIQFPSLSLFPSLKLVLVGFYKSFSSFSAFRVVSHGLCVII
jgi:hypothetical protein